MKTSALGKIHDQVLLQVTTILTIHIHKYLDRMTRLERLEAAELVSTWACEVEDRLFIADLMPPLAQTDFQHQDALLDRWPLGTLPVVTPVGTITRHKHGVIIVCANSDVDKAVSKLDAINQLVLIAWAWRRVAGKIVQGTWFSVDPDPLPNTSNHRTFH